MSRRRRPGPPASLPCHPRAAGCCGPPCGRRGDTAGRGGPRRPQPEGPWRRAGARAQALWGSGRRPRVPNQASLPLHGRRRDASVGHPSARAALGPATSPSGHSAGAAQAGSGNGGAGTAAAELPPRSVPPPQPRERPGPPPRSPPARLTAPQAARAPAPRAAVGAAASRLRPPDRARSPPGCGPPASSEVTGAGGGTQGERGPRPGLAGPGAERGPGGTHAARAGASGGLGPGQGQRGGPCGRKRGPAAPGLRPARLPGRSWAGRPPEPDAARCPRGQGAAVAGSGARRRWGWRWAVGSPGLMAPRGGRPGRPRPPGARAGPAAGPARRAERSRRGLRTG